MHFLISSWKRSTLPFPNAKQSNPPSSVIELNLALICSCMCTLKPFLQHYAPSLRAMSNRLVSLRSKSSSASGAVGNSSGKPSTSSTISRSMQKKKSQDDDGEFIELHDEENPPLSYAAGDTRTHDSNWGRMGVKEQKVVSESRERIVGI